MSTMQYVATSANGKKIYVDMQDSHAATHLRDTPALLELAKELLPTIEAQGDSVYLDKDLGRIVGSTDLVKTNASDEIVYAKRLGRDTYTRFVKNRTSQPTSFVSIVLKKNTDDEYELWSAWIGRAAPQFPGDEHETLESRPFWRTHALVWGNQNIQPDTELHEWPWGPDEHLPDTSRSLLRPKSQSSSEKG